MIGPRRALLWVTAALLGLAVTAALTWSVSRLTAQRIGLSSQPVSAVSGLAPAPAEVSSQPPSEPSEQPTARARTTRSATTTGGATLPQTRGPAPPASHSTTTAGPTGVTSTSPGPTTQATAASSPPPRTNSGDHSEDSGGGRGQAPGGRDD